MLAQDCPRYRAVKEESYKDPEYVKMKNDSEVKQDCCQCMHTLNRVWSSQIKENLSNQSTFGYLLALVYKEPCLKSMKLGLVGLISSFGCKHYLMPM